MRIKLLKLLSGSILLSAAIASSAQEHLVELDIGRGSARLPIYAMKNSNSVATVILLPGGNAGMGEVVDGRPTSQNFLSRTRNEFYNAGFNVLVVFRPTDLKGLDYDYRVSEQHIGELGRAIEFAKDFGKPIWLIGTSRGTVSATATVISRDGRDIQGLVLTASVTPSKYTGAVPTQNIASIKIPTLVVHHKNDACRGSPPDEASRITPAMESASVRKFVMIEGGSQPKGNVCGGGHWHGFINFEKETVGMISNWIKNPQN